MGRGEDDGDARATGRQSGESAARARGGRSGRTRTGRRWWRGRLRGRGRGGEVSGRWRCGTQRRRRCPRASGLLPLPDPDRVGEEGRGGRRAGEAATRRTARRRRRCTRGDRARGDPLPGTMRACVLVCVCCVVAAGEGDEGKVGRGVARFRSPQGAIGTGWAGLVGPEASWAVAQWGGFFPFFFCFLFFFFYSISFQFSFILVL